MKDFHLVHVHGGNATHSTSHQLRTGELGPLCASLSFSYRASPNLGSSDRLLSGASSRIRRFFAPQHTYEIASHFESMHILLPPPFSFKTKKENPKRVIVQRPSQHALGQAAKFSFIRSNNQHLQSPQPFPQPSTCTRTKTPSPSKAHQPSTSRSPVSRSRDGRHLTWLLPEPESQQPGP
jgi:hypothetical protein